MELKFKKLHVEAKTPTRAYEHPGGYDLYSVEKTYDSLSKTFMYSTGIAFEIPTGYVGLVMPRSSIGMSTGLMLTNGVGVIDSDYRGEIKAQFNFRGESLAGGTYIVGARCCQLVVLPLAEITALKEMDELSETQRGSKGFGSSKGGS